MKNSQIQHTQKERNNLQNERWNNSMNLVELFVNIAGKLHSDY
jgi:hypothetical protein